MKNLRRIVICFLLAVAALSALRAPPIFAAQTTAIAAAHDCDCGDHCNLSKNACDQQGLCTAVCNGLMAADVTFAPLAMSTHDSATGPLAAAHDGIIRPPPLGPPRA